MTLAAASQTVSGYVDSVNGTAHPGSRMVIGANAGWTAYWSTMKPFLNLAHHASKYAETGAWLGSGDTAQISSTDRLPAGTYVVTWDGTAECSLQNTDSESSLGAAGYPTVNRKEYVLNNDTGHDGSPLTLACNSGTPTEIRVFDKQYETEMDAGNLIHPDIVTDMSAYSVIRFMDWMATSGNSRESWSSWPTTSWMSWNRGCPMEAMAELCNSTGADCWITVPHMFDTTAMASMATALFNALDVGISVYVEYSNECWNSSSPWRNEYQWCNLLDKTTHVAVYDAADVWDEVAHGWVTGSRVRCFNNNVQSDDFPWSDGGTLTIIRVTDDTFIGAGESSPWSPKVHDGADNASVFQDLSQSWTVDTYVGDTVVNVTDGSYGVVTGNTATTITLSAGLSGGTDNDFDIGDEITVGETTPAAATTRLVYKESLGWNADRSRVAEHSAEKHVECWDEFVTVFGRSRIKKVGGTWFNGGSYTEDSMVYKRWVEDIDFLAIAPYFSGSEPGTKLLTDQEIFDGLQDKSTDVRFSDNHIEKLGRVNLICYEGGNHWPAIPDVDDFYALQSFMDTQLMKDYSDQYLKDLHGQGCSVFCHYMSHYLNKESTSNLWGAQSWQGKRDEPAYLSLKEANDAGGATL